MPASERTDNGAPSGFSRMTDGPALTDCENLGRALTGDIGAAVEQIQTLILRYYNDVRGHAAMSFGAASRVAMAGFVVLLVTLAYVIIADVLTRTGRFPVSKDAMTVGQLGL